MSIIKSPCTPAFQDQNVSGMLHLNIRGKEASEAKNRFKKTRSSKMKVDSKLNELLGLRGLTCLPLLPWLLNT